MATNTANYNLIKPDGNPGGDLVDINVLNTNMDSIDTALHNHDLTLAANAAADDARLDALELINSFVTYDTVDPAYQPAINTVWTAEGANGLTKTFNAPASGKVKISIAAYLYQATASKLQQFGYKITGGLVRDPLDSETIRIIGVGAARLGTSFLLTGLVPGTAYTLSSAFKTDVAAAAPYMSFRSLMIEAM